VIAPETIAKIRNLFFAEHWTVGTIARELGLHWDTVRAALETERFNHSKQDRANQRMEHYVSFIQQTLKEYPRLRATRI